MAKSIYICYFGVRQPLVQTQVVPYLLELRKDGVEIVLLTFEPDLRKQWTAEQVTEMKREMAEKGIEWHCLAYHKKLSVLATSYDILAGAMFIRRMINAGDIDILHGRVHVPTLMGAIARRLSRHKPKLLFDIRGFFPEEYTDAGIWPENGIIYRSVKRIEKWLMKEADAFVVLTEKAREILFPESKATGFDKVGRPVEVIPCCVDLARFDSATENSRSVIREQLSIDRRFVIAYIGSFGGWYLTEETADFYGEAKRANAAVFALILTQSKPEVIAPLLRERGFDESDYLITQVSPGEIPLYLSGADASISFIKPCYSKQASSPTKNAEYLACGLPIIANDGVGDTTEQLTEDKTGVIIGELNVDGYNLAFRELNEMLSHRAELALRCRQSAEKRFDLVEVGGTRYRRLYKRLLR